MRAPWIVLTAFLAGCSGLLDVETPDIIDATTLDGRDPLILDIFARSAQTAFGSAYGDVVRFGALFTTELQYTGTSEPEGQFAVRSVSSVNLLTPLTLWGPLSSARVQADNVLRLFGNTLPTTTSLNGARAALFSGYSILLMGEMFCLGTLADVNTGQPGGVLLTEQVLDSAIARFGLAIEIATRALPTLTGAGLAEAQAFVGAARVGRARAALQRGMRALALADANAVPAGFTYNMQFVDDASNRTRVSNRIWQFTQTSGQLSVPAAYRALGDPRVAWQNPVGTLPAQDGSQLFAQGKYASFNAPIRLASRLEAEYIAAEAQLPNTGPALALIAARRAAGGQTAYSGGTDSASVLAELMDQRGRDFYIEGKRMGDYRRAVATYANPALLRQVLPTGSPYPNKPNLGAAGAQQCIPLPESETLNNPNFPRG